MPFGSMASVVSDKTKDRTKLSRVRVFGGMTVGFGYLSSVPSLIWDKENKPVASGYFIFAVISAILCIVCYNVLFRCTVERIKTEHKPNEKFDYLKVLREAFKNRTLLGIMLASIGSLKCGIAENINFRKCRSRARTRTVYPRVFERKLEVK